MYFLKTLMVETDDIGKFRRSLSLLQKAGIGCTTSRTDTGGGRTIFRLYVRSTDYPKALSLI